MKKLVFILALVIAIFTGCNNGIGNKEKEKEKIDLKVLSEKIDSEFVVLKPIITELADSIAELYKPENAEKNIKTVNKEDYILDKSGALYKKDYGENSAVFVSGFVPVDEKIKKIVYFTEPIDKKFKEIVSKYKEIAQVYYNDKYSYNRIYPGFDVLAQYQSKMNIPSFNFYYLADEKNNPNKGAVWVDEPYLDPAGRGWMVSLIAPVYVEGNLEGVPGIDITIEKIIEKYINIGDITIVSKSGTVVATSEKNGEILMLPRFKDHKYIETVKSDTFLETDFNLLKSKSKEVRDIAEKIIKMGEREIKFESNGKKYLILTENIRELSWRIVKIIEY